MIFREARVSDIEQIQVVRHSVKENTLSDPALVTDKDCEDHINYFGKGWVCEHNGDVIAFAFVNLEKNNIWALFVDPAHEKKGIGKKLQNMMLTWYFHNTRETVWLTTAPGTRAEKFYEMTGWEKKGMVGNGSRAQLASLKNEVRFELSYNNRVKANNK